VLGLSYIFLLGYLKILNNQHKKKIISIFIINMVKPVLSLIILFAMLLGIVHLKALKTTKFGAKSDGKKAPYLTGGVPLVGGMVGFQ
jgi:hypothetical protein